MSNPIYADQYYTAGNEHEVVLFRIGMRFNRWGGLRGLREGVGAFFRMPFMLMELQKNPALGLLDSQIGLALPNIVITQFWRSYEDLDRYASARDRKHAPAWGWWNKMANKTGAVGIWHETYRIAPGSYESIYGCMPKFGVALATDHRPIAAGEARSRNRINATPAAVTSEGVCPVSHAT